MVAIDSTFGIVMSDSLPIFSLPLTGFYLLEASAGTGKTWHITALVVRCVLEKNMPMQSLLAVTYTNAAAAELKERIVYRLREVQQYLIQMLDDSDKKDDKPFASDPFITSLCDYVASIHLSLQQALERIHQALRDIDDACISTIHGFCQRVLTRWPLHVLPIPSQMHLEPNLRPLYESLAYEFLWQQILYAKDHHALDALAIKSNWIDDGLAKELVNAIALRENWSFLPYQALSDEQLISDQTDVISVAIAQIKSFLTETAIAQLSECLTLGKLKKNIYSLEKISEAAQQWKTLINLKSHEFNDFVKANEKCLERLSYQKIFLATTKNAQLPSDLSPLFAYIKDFFIAWDTQKKVYENWKSYLMHRWLVWCQENLIDAKHAKQCIGFQDLLQWVAKAVNMNHTEQRSLANMLRLQFTHVFIDEFQDTDYLQFSIFERIWLDTSAHDISSMLYFVGDPKQAIYRFKGADIYCYLNASKHQQVRRLQRLSENQRSSKELLIALNAVWQQRENPFVVPDIVYDEVSYGSKPRLAFEDKHALIAHIHQRAAFNVWCLPWDDKALSLTQARSFAMHACAREIVRLLSDESGVYRQQQSLCANDIAVLVRSNAEGSQMRAILSSYHIDAIELKRQSVFLSQACEEIRWILHAICQPKHLGLLRGALASLLWGGHSEIIEKTHDDGIFLSDWLWRLKEYFQLWQTKGFTIMWQKIWAEIDDSRIVLLPKGERYLVDCQHLAEILQEESLYHFTPESLLQWLSNQQANAMLQDGSGTECIQRLESDRQLVNIVTVHKSKGLEYPIVFCPTLFMFGVSKRQPQSAVGRVYRSQLFPDASQTPMGYISFMPASLEEALFDTYQETEREEQLAEELRLIYVALTRAIDRIYIITGYVPNRTKAYPALFDWLALPSFIESHAPEKKSEEKANISHILKTPCTQSSLNAWKENFSYLPNNVLMVCQVPEISLPHEYHQHKSQHLSAPFLPFIPKPRLKNLSFSILIAADDYSTQHNQASHLEKSIEENSLAWKVLDEKTDELIDRHEVLTFTDLEARDFFSKAFSSEMIHFPRGKIAGHVLHAAFEWANYQNPDDFYEVAKRALDAFPITQDEKLISIHGHDVFVKMLEKCLFDVTQTTLVHDFRLCDVACDKQWREWKFTLSASDIQLNYLRKILNEAGYGDMNIQGYTGRGEIRGVIDWFGWHQGKIWLIDWKSNYLGDQAQDYSTSKIFEAMQSAGYFLQAILYVVALKRWWQVKLPSLDFYQYFGGIIYVFARGITFSAQGQPSSIVQSGLNAISSLPYGVYFDLPNVELIKQCDQALS